MTPDDDITSSFDTNFHPTSFCPPPFFIFIFLNEQKSIERIFL